MFSQQDLETRVPLAIHGRFADGGGKKIESISIKEALSIAESCFHGRGPNNPETLVAVIVRLLESQGTCSELVSVAGHLYTVIVHRIQEGGTASSLRDENT